MKRWQDRGEVLDSDEEDLEFSNESPSPEQPRKRQRIDASQTKEDEEFTTEPVANDGLPSDDVEEPWLLPKMATTYGKRSRVSRPGSRDGGLESAVGFDEDSPVIAGSELSEQVARLCSEPSKSSQPSNPDAGQEPATSGVTSGDIADGKQVDEPVIAEENLHGGESASPSEELQEELGNHDPGRVTAKQASPGSTRSSESDELPNPSQIFGGKDRTRPHTPVNDDKANDSSALTSPLSSPETPALSPQFRFPRTAVAVEIPTQQPHEPNSARGVSDADVATALETENAVLNEARRSLRARTEKQLHPYMYERTVYQQQWRQRGLRPIHFVDPGRPANGEHHESYDTEESGSQAPPSSSQDPPSSQAAASQPTAQPVPRKPSKAPVKDSGFQDIDALLGDGIPEHAQNRHKRRKLSHQPTGKLKSIRNWDQQDDTDALPQEESSVPISPPPTSSDSSRRHVPHELHSGFRLPYGKTPAPLPTPQISSDVRPSGPGAAMESDTDSPPSRRPRTSTLSRVQSRITTIPSDSESASSSDSEADVEERRLMREKKRIRGVLPASWLKIDLRTRQKQPSPSPPRTRRPSTTSPHTEHRLKGVAQKIQRTSNTPSRSNIIDITDSGEEDEVSNRGSPEPVRQRSLEFGHANISIGRETVDNERMEVDWIDPMLPAPSRQRTNDSKGKKRQPKIKDALQRVRQERVDFSEERTGLRHAHGKAVARKKGEHQPPGARKERRSRHRQSSIPVLSILDAPGAGVEDEDVPPFVRLAQRQARRQPGYGRHSPSRKHIRLATKHDTDDAMTVLSAWREGTIAPRSTPELVPRQHSGGQAVQKNRASSMNLKTHNSMPLEEIVNDSRQQQLPAPLRKETGCERASTPQSVPAKHRQPRRTRLQPIILERRGQLSAAARNPASANKQSEPGKTPDLQHPRNINPGHRLRGAQVETLETAFDRDHRAAAFERRMNILTEGVARPLRRSAYNDLPLSRFLEENTPSLPEPDVRPAHGHNRSRSSVSGDDSGREQNSAHVAHQTLPHRPRKHPARRLNAESREYRQPSEPLPDPIVIADDPDVAEEAQGPVLQGLNPFGVRYATDFDVQPLHADTYFHQTTFIGSGDFAAALKVVDRDLNVATGRIRIHVNESPLVWETWTEDVAVGMNKIARAIQDALASLKEPSPAAQLDLDVVLANVDHMLRSVVRYLSKCLSFLDSVDRRVFLQHLKRFVDDLNDALIDAAAINHDLLLRCSQYALVLATQARLISANGTVTSEVRRACQELKSVTARKLAALLPSAIEKLRAFYEDNRRISRREAGIRDEDQAISAVVVLHHCLRDDTDAFWQTLRPALKLDIGTLNSVGALDQRWYNVFSILPALEIDVNGIARPGSRLRNTQRDWSIVKPLLDRVFALYPATSSMRGNTVNEYVRAVLTRGWRLLSHWGWYNCEPALYSTFDFFARRSLALLDKEESHGSPKFLSELEQRLAIEVQPEDRSFHIFLKIVAYSFQAMQNHGVSNKKIGNILWRLLPNHGRTYRKDADVKRADLDALRNHHDLLSVLYYASPASHRPPLHLLRNLVDHSTSHREACRLHVRAWANLASFQASTSETLATLEVFADWYQDMSATTIAQYRLAQTEAETDFAIAKAKGSIDISDSLLTSTIASNQRHIAATLIDALAGLKRALKASVSLTAAVILVEKSDFWRPFVPFDAAEKRLCGALEEALEVTKAAVEVHRRFSCSGENQQPSEESQDYGDSSALQEFAATQAQPSADTTTIPAVLQDSLAALMSNVFGADQALDDHLLTKLIDIWLDLAGESVKSGTKTWSSFLDHYSSHSWHQLRNTDQKRKCTPYFVARFVETAGDDAADVKLEVLTAWLVSLVEREAMLKYQHLLTTTLLNVIEDDPLLENLPFTRDDRSGKYYISFRDLRDRRLSLLSSILSNMREIFEETQRFRPQQLHECRKSYEEMLKTMMQAMKANYQELRASSNAQSADPSVQGAYVDFVQHVVSFLQSTADICKVDSFFTDSSAFPLPATDPTYVVGRLKSYVPRLADLKTQKQLAAFVQGVGERAAVDGQQSYLVQQLCAALDGTVELGRKDAPSLRHVMLTAVFPVHIEAALSAPCSWITALPVLEACAIAASDLLYQVQLENESSVNAVLEMAGIVLHSLHEPITFALEHPGHLKLPHAQRVLAFILAVGQSLITPCRHLERSGIAGSSALTQSLDNMRVLALAIQSHLTNSPDSDFLNLPHPFPPPPKEPWPDAKTFTRNQLRYSLQNTWHASDGQYFFGKGPTTAKEVVVRVGEDGDVREELLQDARAFVESFGVIVGGQERWRERRAVGFRGSAYFSRRGAEMEELGLDMVMV
jgi:hypothetical protein